MVKATKMVFENEMDGSEYSIHLDTGDLGEGLGFEVNGEIVWLSIDLLDWARECLDRIDDELTPS